MHKNEGIGLSEGVSWDVRVGFIRVLKERKERQRSSY